MGKYDRTKLVNEYLKDKGKLEEILFNWAALVDSADDAIIGKTLDGIITSWNRGAERMYGYTAEEMIGRPISFLVPPGRESEMPKIMERVKNGEVVDHYETKRKTKNGQIITVSLIVSPVRDENGNITGAIKIAHQVSQQLELERQKQLNQQKNEFISMASHELKTPLTTLKTYIQVALKENEKIDNPLITKSLTKADSQINRLTKLVNELLALSRMQVGSYRYEMGAFDINELLRDIVEDFQGISSQHKIKLEGTINKSVFGDKDKVGQIIINLITNAIKYSPGKDRVNIKVNDDKNNVIVSVQDFGIGIDTEYQDRIFEQFYQVTTNQERTFPGMGIGLFIASEIVKAHNGSIWVESKKGEGSTFSFSLPL